MKDIYEKLSIDIEILSKIDVITTSSPYDDNNNNNNDNEEAFEHDNAFFDWNDLE